MMAKAGGVPREGEEDEKEEKENKEEEEEVVCEEGLQGLISDRDEPGTPR